MISHQVGNRFTARRYKLCSETTDTAIQSVVQGTMKILYEHTQNSKMYRLMIYVM